MNRENSSMRTSIVDYCESIGSDPMLVQGAGGNVSWKDNDTLWIKASGTWLADAAVKDIFVPVDLPHLNAAIESKNFSVSPRLLGESVLRPSIETLLHALMPHQVVVHLHAVEALSYLVRVNSETEIKNKLKNHLQWKMVKYQKPGEELAKSVANAISLKNNTNIFLLENHGVVIGGEDVSEVGSLLKQLLTILYTDVPPSISDSEISKILTLNDFPQYKPISIMGIHNLALQSEFYQRLKTDWLLYPDHVVFLGIKAFCYDSIEMFHDDLSNGASPELVFLKGNGVFTTAEFTVAKLAQLECYYNVLIRQPKSTHLKNLKNEEVAKLLNWDAEHYRQKHAK